MQLPRIPFGDWIESGLDFLTTNLSGFTKAISAITEQGIDTLVDALLFVPPWLMIIIITAIAWRLTSRKVGIFTFLGLLFILSIELWSATISTIAMVIIATFVAVAIGIPLGIWAALRPRAKRVIMPILDFMQTMPAFVYLIPAIPFFGLGPVAAIFSTVIFAMPPAIRLTCLGIEQVPVEMIEAVPGSVPG